MKKIVKGSFWYKVAYGWNWRSHCETRVHLCVFMKMCALGLVTWPLIFLGLSVLWTLVYTCLFLFGYKPRVAWSIEGPSPIVPIRHCPGWLPPIVLIITTAILWGQSPLIHYLNKTSVLNQIVVGLSLMILLFIAVISITAYYVYKIRSSEGLQLFKAYIKAKKEKVCPFIEIVDPETEVA